jgi:hypothetical protein
VVLISVSACSGDSIFIFYFFLTRGNVPSSQTRATNPRKGTISKFPHHWAGPRRATKLNIHVIFVRVAALISQLTSKRAMDFIHLESYIHSDWALGVDGYTASFEEVVVQASPKQHKSRTDINPLANYYPRFQRILDQRN